MVGNNLSIYRDYADEWWQPSSYYFRSLQSITPFRLELIREMCGDVRGLDVLDLGCGGGLISVPLLDSGARVTGVDISPESIAVAKRVSADRGTFIAADITKVPLPENCADLIIIADVLDHIPAYERALSEASRLVRPDGMIFVCTINRTFWSWFFAIALGERILRYIPEDTHAYSLFIKPKELRRSAEQANLSLVAIQGEHPLILATLKKKAVLLRKSKSSLIAYSMLFIRKR